MTAHTQGAILVGVDNSPNSNIAAAWAVAIARATGSPIRAVAAWTRRAPSGLGGVDDHITETNAYTASTVAQSLHSAGLDAIELGRQVVGVMHQNGTQRVCLTLG